MKSFNIQGLIHGDGQIFRCICVPSICRTSHLSVLGNVCTCALKLYPQIVLGSVRMCVQGLKLESFLGLGVDAVLVLFW
ncbi:hypothetical protein LCGC14_2469190 [marine sediment metagenome]|uniref:Uncharacterized protein n=1 Tax=marine sediment metagenome TaxID=412755 RepID=A0A0F9BBH9_9ZZZZ